MDAVDQNTIACHPQQVIPIHTPFKLFLTRKISFTFYPHFSIFCLGFNDSSSTAQWSVTQGAAERHTGDTE